MARRRYDHRWKEVRLINSYAMLQVYVYFVVRGIAYLVVTWITVVLLGGFVSMIDKKDFWLLTLITLMQLLWIKTTFFRRAASSSDLLPSSKTVKNVLTRKWQLADKARRDDTKMAVIKRGVAAVRVVVGWVLALVNSVLLHLSVISAVFLFYFGLLITTSLSIYGLVKHNYKSDGLDRKNMYPAHTVLYILCVVQGTLYLYLFVLAQWWDRIVNQVSQAYGFQDDGRAVRGYCTEIADGCEKNPSSAGERNLITYAIELMDSKSHSSYLSGTLILDRLLTRQYSDQIIAPTLIGQEEKQRQQEQQKRLYLEKKTVAQLIEVEEKSMDERKKKREERRKNRQQREEAIIVQQRKVIKRLIGSASSTHILQKLLQTLDSRRSGDKKMREAAARIVEHVAGGIRLVQFPGGITCISSLINNFEEYLRLQPYEPSPSNTDEATTMTVPPSSNRNENNGDEQEQGSSNPSPESESEEEPESESESESEPASEDSESEPETELYSGTSSSKPLNGYRYLVLTGLSIIWRLAGSEDNCIIIGNTKHIVSKIIAPVTYDTVHRTGHCAWSTSVVEASMKVMLRLIAAAKDNNGEISADMRRQLSNNGAITTMENIVTCEECKGGKLQMTAMEVLIQLNRCKKFTKMLVDVFRNTAGKEVVLLFLGSKSIATLLSKEENDEFVGGVIDIISQDGNDDERKKAAAEILEHMCIHYTENDEYLLNQKEKYNENAQHLSTLKAAMEGAMPKVLGEILRSRALTGEERKPGYLTLGTDIESQVTADGISNNKNCNNTSSSHWQNQHQKLYVALLSLCVTACEKLDLDMNTILSGGGGGQGDVAFRFATQMVLSNRHRISADSLTVIKLSSRMAIARMTNKNNPLVKSADLDSLMDSLTSISETMLDLDGSMVFTAGTTTTTVPTTDDTLNSLMKRAQQLHSELENKESQISAS